jgi:hypothetical protein
MPSPAYCTKFIRQPKIRGTEANSGRIPTASQFERFGMYEVFSHEPHFLFSIIAMMIVFGSIAGTILGVAGMLTWRKHVTTKMEHDLKSEMVAAGMSADEIQRVMAAKFGAK